MHCTSTQIAELLCTVHSLSYRPWESKELQFSVRPCPSLMVIIIIIVILHLVSFLLSSQFRSNLPSDAPFTPPPFSIQTDMAYQLALRIGTCPHSKLDKTTQCQK